MTETDSNSKACTAIVCSVRVVTRRQPRMQMLAEAVKVEAKGGEAVNVAVEFHTTELAVSFHHILVESLVHSTQWAGFFMRKKISPSVWKQCFFQFVEIDFAIMHCNT